MKVAKVKFIKISIINRHSYSYSYVGNCRLHYVLSTCTATQQMQDVADHTSSPLADGKGSHVNHVTSNYVITLSHCRSTDVGANRDCHS